MNYITMSLLTGIAIVFLVILRCFTINRLPKKLFLTLWDLIIFHLMLLILLPVDAGIYKTMDIYMNIPGEGSELYFVGTYPVESNVFYNYFHQNHTVIITIWLIVAMILLSVFILQYRMEYRRLQQALPLSDDPWIEQWLHKHTLKRRVGIMMSDRILTPLTYGSFKPKIVLPKHMDLQDRVQLEYVLEHELVHIRRFDHLRKSIMLFVLCFHWFNPFVWIMFCYLQRDMELYCDEMVILSKDDAGRTAYAHTLVKAAARQAGISYLSNGFGRNAVEERIISVMKYKKPTWLRSMLSFLIVLCSVIIFILIDLKRYSVTEGVTITVSGNTAYGYGEIMSGTRNEEGSAGWDKVETDLVTAYIPKPGVYKLQDISGNIRMVGIQE